jgi:hypothetical protein
MRFDVTDEFLRLPSADRREVINAAAHQLGMLPALAEKDVWVCFVLKSLFSIPERRQMVFKGGTSLSKVFNLIERFSEDIDISINFLQDYEHPISKTRAANMRQEIETNLQRYKKDILFPALQEQVKNLDLAIEPGDTAWEIDVNYNSVLLSGVDYIKTRVKIELSGRNETEPSEKHVVRPYLADQTTDLFFPEATIDALLAERTFWEKVTLIHAGLNSGSVEITPERLSRHWSDVSVLMQSEVGERAIQNKELCFRVVNHKESFWRDAKAKYDDCRQKKFKLVPTGKTRVALRADYEAMLDAGMFFSENPATFDQIMHNISALETRLNT